MVLKKKIQDVHHSWIPALNCQAETADNSILWLTWADRS
jgi:hypothetical protein